MMTSFRNYLPCATFASAVSNSADIHGYHVFESIALFNRQAEPPSRQAGQSQNAKSSPKFTRLRVELQRKRGKGE